MSLVAVTLDSAEALVPRHKALRWTAVFVLVLAGHVAALMPLMARHHAVSDREAANAVMIDLAIDAESSQAVVSDAKLPRDMQFSLPSDFKLAAPPEVEPLEQALAKEAAQPSRDQEPREAAHDTAAPPWQEAKAEPEPLSEQEPVRDVVPVPQDEAPALLPPERIERSEPKQEPRKPTAEPKKEKPKPKMEARKQNPAAKPKTVQPIRTAKAEATGQAAESTVAQKAASPAPSGGSAAGLADWRAQLRAHLERHKRFPADADPARDHGLARVSFVVDLQGRVLSKQLAASSGSAALDREAVSLLQRAQPLPPPPREMGRSTVAVTVPISFQTR